MKKLLLVLIWLLAVATIHLPKVVLGQCSVSITASPSDTVCAGQTVTLNAVATGGTIPYTYLWSTGATSQAITTMTSGIFTVTVTDGSATPCTNTPQVVVTVNPLPVPNFSFTPDNQCSPMNVQFTNLSTGQAPLTYLWNFGDPSSLGNNTSNSEDPSHIFISIGGGNQTYNVSLTVTDANGCSATITKQVVVKQIPDASIADITGTWKHCVSGSNIAYTLEIDNTSTTIGTNTHYHIDWGDFSLPYDDNTLPNGTTHNYTTVGNFPVVLTVTNSQCSNTKTYYFFNGSTPYAAIQREYFFTFPTIRVRTI